MTETRVARFAVSVPWCVALSWLQFPLWVIGEPPSVYDGAGYARHLLDIRTMALLRVLMDQGIYVGMMVFAAGFRHLVRHARLESEWLGTLTFGASVVWLAVTLVADGLMGGAVLDTLRGDADASAVRALVMGTMLIYNGSIPFAITDLFLVSAAWATLDSGVLPRWTGWLAHIAAALCLISVPAIFTGPTDGKGFYNPVCHKGALAPRVPTRIVRSGRRGVRRNEPRSRDEFLARRTDEVVPNSSPDPPTYMSSCEPAFGCQFQPPAIPVLSRSDGIRRLRSARVSTQGSKGSLSRNFAPAVRPANAV